MGPVFCDRGGDGLGGDCGSGADGDCAPGCDRVALLVCTACNCSSGNGIGSCAQPRWPIGGTCPPAATCGSGTRGRGDVASGGKQSGSRRDGMDGNLCAY